MPSGLSLLGTSLCSTSTGLFATCRYRRGLVILPLQPFGQELYIFSRFFTVVWYYLVDLWFIIKGKHTNRSTSEKCSHYWLLSAAKCPPPWWRRVISCAYWTTRIRCHRSVSFAGWKCTPWTFPPVWTDTAWAPTYKWWDIEDTYEVSTRLLSLAYHQRWYCLR